MKHFVPLLFVFAACSADFAQASPADRPNIVWILVDDMSANFSCYGEKRIETPHVDRLAREGVRFTRAFTTAPVCSPSRSALITGMYQTSIGAQNHRSGRGSEKIQLPEGVTPLPALFKQAGYYTCIGSGKKSGEAAGGGAAAAGTNTTGAKKAGGKKAAKKAAADNQPAQSGGEESSGKGLGKTDYNFEYDRSMYDGPDWSGRAADQPFFMQVTLAGGKQRGGTSDSARAFSTKAARILGAAVKPDDVSLPPYYPRDPVLLEDWAAYLDSVRTTDRAVGDVLTRLESEGILDSTLVVFLTDHGISHARGKQFLYDEGIHIPLVMRGPKTPKGTVRDDLVSHIDLAATSLAYAGLPVPSGMQGRDLFAADFKPRDAVFAARDRCDETVEHIRAVRTDRYKYIRNYLPQRPHLQPNNYKDGKSIVIRLRELHAEGKLNAIQEKLLFSPTRAPEELYDLAADPHETKNLADDFAHRKTLEALRARLDRWVVETGDRGARPEPESMYDSDMRVYLGEKKNEAQRAVTEANIKQMKAWAAEGK